MLTSLDLLLRTLASPTRLRILKLLQRAPPTRCALARGPHALAATLRLAPSTVTFHLKVLLRMRLVRYWKKERYKFYHLRLAPSDAVRSRLFQRILDEIPDGLGPVPEHRSRAAGARRTRPHAHSGARTGPLAPLWSALTSFSFFRRLLLLRVLHREGAASVPRLMAAMDLTEPWVAYHVDKLTRRRIIEKVPLGKAGDGYRLCPKPPTALQGFLTRLLERELAARA